ncbi:MAG: MBL fold metallo-hydrolase [Candidatus Hodarchaeota archaeon]
MTAIREPGKINENTTLIDIGFFGVAGTGAVYLVEAGKSCLIDCGTPSEAFRIIKTLKKMKAFPPDYIALTHSHWDHSQGVSIFRKEALKEQRTITVLASEKAISLLEDQSFNKIFNPKKRFENIKDVSPLKEGDQIDLEGLTLDIIEVPGHSKDHIAFFDTKNKTLFVGDSIGLKFGGSGTHLPPFMPPYWNKEDFYLSVEKLKQVDFEGICLSHFGYIYNKEAKNLLVDVCSVTDQWWQLFEKAEKEDKLDDTKYLTDLIMKETNLVIPDFKIEKFVMKFLLGLINSIRKIIRKDPLLPGHLLLPEVVGWFVSGYKIFKDLE